MSNILDSFNKIKLNIDKLKPERAVKIVAISKTFTLRSYKTIN